MAQYTQRIGGAPVADEVLVSADQVTILGSGTAIDPLRLASASGGGSTFDAVVSSLASAGAYILGTAASVTGFLNGEPQVGRCVGNTTVACAGLAVVAAAGPTFPTKIQTDGIVTLTTAQWDAVAGTSGGLSAGDPYWVSESTAGHLTDVQPTTGHRVTLVGYGVSPTQLRLNIQPPTLS